MSQRGSHSSTVNTIYMCGYLFTLKTINVDCMYKVCYILTIYFVTILITLSNGMESNSPGEVMNNEDLGLKDIQEMVCIITI